MEKGLTTLKDLLMGDRIFRIPRYQRNYAWGHDQLEDFWEDLKFLERGKKHYFGTVILKQFHTPKKTMLKTFDVYDVVDGQQRITTAMILIGEILSQLKAVEKPEIKEQLSDLFKNYLKYDKYYKLELLGDDREFFENRIVDGREFPDEILTPSQRRLRDAKEFFVHKLVQQKRLLRGDGFMDLCTGLKDKIDQLELMTYPVDNDIDAVLIFETVNDRGKPLGNLDKTKSFLMHMTYLSTPEGSDPEPDLLKIEERFGNIFRYFEGLLSSSRNLDIDEDDIQRYHFIAFESSAKGEKKNAARYLDFLKDVCRAKYNESKSGCLAYVAKYSEDLEKGYYGMKEIITYGPGDTIGDSLDSLFVLGRVANFYPLLITSWVQHRNDTRYIERLLKLLETYVMRIYVVGGKRADTGIHQIYLTANELHNNVISQSDAYSRIADLVKEYEPDDVFRRDLSVEDLYDRLEARDIKYILYFYEMSLRHGAKEPLALNLANVMSEKFEIEHIWARSPISMTSEIAEEHRKVVHRLGNLTLASRSWNASWGNKPFAEKRDADMGYRSSTLRVQKELADVQASEWRSSEIEDREKRLIEFCLHKWTISEMDI